MENNKEYYRKIFQERLFCDAKIVTEDGWSFDVHRLILARKSPLFYDLFSYFPNDREPTLIPKVRGETLNQVLYFIYTDSVDLRKENCMDILIASDFLRIENLHKKTKKYAESILSTENCFQIYVTCKQYNEDHLRELSLRFMQINFERLRNETNFAEISVVDLKEILKSNSLRVTEEKVVFEFIEEWANRDRANRFKEVCCLLKCLKVGDIEESLASQIIQSDIISKNKYCVELENAAFQKFEYSLDALKYIINNTTESPEIPLSDVYSRRLPENIHVIVGRKTLGGDGNPGIYISYDEKLDFWRKMGKLEQFSSLPHFHILGSNVYAFGLNAFGPPTKAMIFNLCEQEWREMENAFEGMRCTFFHSVVHGNKICFVYEDSIDFGVKAKIYNTESGLWSISMAMPIIFPYKKVVSHLNKIFVLGERSGKLTLLVYDEVSNSWFLIDSPIVDRKSFLLTAYHDKLYIIGGFNSKNEFITTVDVFDIGTNEWERIDNLPFDIEDSESITVVTFKDKLFVILERFNGRSVMKQFVLTETTWVEPKEPLPVGNFNFFFFHGPVFHTIYDKHIISELVKKNKLAETILEKSPFK